MCDDRFEVVVHHGGYFERNEARWSYSNGLMSTTKKWEVDYKTWHD